MEGESKISYDVGPEDEAQGVVAYTEYLVGCPITGKLTNCVFRNRVNGKLVLAYNQEAADKIGVSAAA